MAKPRAEVSAFIGGDWEDRFSLTYAAMSLKNRHRRRAFRSGHHRPSDAQDDADRLLFHQIATMRKQSRDAAVQKRWRDGFVWRGGSVGGNPLYARPPFVYSGLVSDEAAILKLFATKTPRARRLLTGHSKDLVDGTDSKLLALDCAYITTNARMRGVLRVEIDACLASWDVIPAACAQAGVPIPNVAVGWVDSHGAVLHPHLIWLLEHSVAFTHAAKKPPQRMYAGVLHGLTAALVPHGADPGGLLNAQRVKNPLSPLWDRAIFATKPYCLKDVCQYLASVHVRPLQLVRPTSSHWVPDHPDPAIAIHSNRVFRHVACWARAEVDHFRNAAQSLEDFTSAVTEQALQIARRMTGDTRKAESAAERTAQAVAKWTWERYRPRRRQSDVPPTQTELRSRQAAAGQTTAANRRACTEAAILAVVMTLAQRSSGPLTQTHLAAATGKSERTIRRYWPLVIAHARKTAGTSVSAPTPAIRCALDKKPYASTGHTSATTSDAPIPLAPQDSPDTLSLAPPPKNTRTKNLRTRKTASLPTPVSTTPARGREPPKASTIFRPECSDFDQSPAPALRQPDPIEAYDSADQTPELVSLDPRQDRPFDWDDFVANFRTPELSSIELPQADPLAQPSLSETTLELVPGPGETDPVVWNNPDDATPELVALSPHQDEPIDWARIEREIAESAAPPALDQDEPIDSDQVEVALEPVSLDPCRYLGLSPELQHAQPLPAFNAARFIGRNVLIENAANEPIGLVFERYRSLLRSFLIGTDTVYDKELTEQWGADVWRKYWAFPRKRESSAITPPRTFNHLKTVSHLVLCLDPRTELRFKVARQAFHREPIEYDNLLATLVHDRLFKNLPTWLFTPCRVNDPEFTAIYGEAFARLITTSFHAVHFGPPTPGGSPVRRNPSLQEDAQLAQTPPPIFLDPATGETFNAQTGERERPPTTRARVRKNQPSVASPCPRPTSPDEVPPQYAAKIKTAREEKLRRLGVAAAEPAKQAIPAPPATDRLARLVYCEDQLPRWEPRPLLFPGEPPGM